MRSLLLCMWLVAAQLLSAQTPQYAFTNLAGWPSGPGWADGPPEIAQFAAPYDLAEDSAGDLYVADSNNQVIRKISPKGVVTTVAGQARVTGSADGQGHAAQFNSPRGLALDKSGYLYVADTQNYTIRKMSPGGMVETVAGTAGLSGLRDGIGGMARFRAPRGLATDAQGNLWVADSANHAVRKITPDGMVTTLGGLNAVSFNNPIAVAIDKTGNILVADAYDDTIRKVDAQGTVTILAGVSGHSGAVDGVSTEARFFGPSGLAVADSGTIYVADNLNHAIRAISPDGFVTTLAGSLGQSGDADGLGSSAQFRFPNSVLAARLGGLYVADTSNDTIRRVSPTGEVTTVAGLPPRPGSDDGTGRAATFRSPGGIAVDGGGNLYVSDNYYGLLRTVNQDGQVTTLAGKAGENGGAEGYYGEARFDAPAGITTDGQGNVFIADAGNHTIRKMAPDGYVSVYAGSFNSASNKDGQWDVARFNTPSGVALDANGALYVADSSNNSIRKITPDRLVFTLTGGHGAGSMDGSRLEAQFRSPNGVAVGRNGDVYVGDTGNHTIRKVTPEGVVTTLAGLAGTHGSADGQGTAARFYNPWGLAVDSSENVYVCDYNNFTIRKVSPAGVVTTIGGLAGIPAYTDGVGSVARFSLFRALALDSSGNLYVADTFNNRVTKGIFLPACTLKPNGNLIEWSIGAYKGASYAFESATSLEGEGDWQAVPGMENHEMSTDGIIISMPKPTADQRFFRVRPVP